MDRERRESVGAPSPSAILTCTASWIISLESSAHLLSNVQARTWIKPRRPSLVGVTTSSLYLSSYRTTSHQPKFACSSVVGFPCVTSFRLLLSSTSNSTTYIPKTRLSMIRTRKGQKTILTGVQARVLHHRPHDGGNVDILFVDISQHLLGFPFVLGFLSNAVC